MVYIKKQEEAVIAVETRDHLSNGVSPKNQKNRRNFLESIKGVDVKFFGVCAVLLLVGASVLLFYACKKDIKTQDNSNMPVSKCIFGEISFIENPYPIEEYLPNPEDIDDEKIDRQLYKIGLMARHFFKNTNLNSFIIETAIQNSNDCIDLRNFKSWSPVIAGMETGEYSVDMVNELQNIINGINLRYISKNPEVFGEVEHYIPALFVVNAEKADPNKMPIFSPGIFVNEELSGMEEYEDHIVIWYFDIEKGEFREALLSEEKALTITNPIIIVDNADEKMTKSRKERTNPVRPIEPCKGPITQEMRRAYYSSYEYEVYKRCENSGKSEFCVVSGAIDENGGGVYWVNNANFWHLISKVKKDDIGKQLSTWKTFCYPYSTAYPDFVPFRCNYLFWNTFERDWAKSPKNLGRATANGTRIELGGNMKYDSDWYTYNPSDVQNSPFEFYMTFTYGSRWYRNIKIYRIDR